MFHDQLFPLPGGVDCPACGPLLGLQHRCLLNLVSLSASLQRLVDPSSIHLPMLVHFLEQVFLQEKMTDFTFAPAERGQWLHMVENERIPQKASSEKKSESVKK
jgi:hypothetical protein